MNNEFRTKGDGSFTFGSRTWPGLAELVRSCGQLLTTAGTLMNGAGENTYSAKCGYIGREIAVHTVELFAASRAFFQLNGFDGDELYNYPEYENSLYQKHLKAHSNSLADADDTPTLTPHRDESVIRYYFEEWILGDYTRKNYPFEGDILERHETGEYLHHPINMAWYAFKAGHEYRAR